MFRDTPFAGATVWRACDLFGAIEFPDMLHENQWVYEEVERYSESY